MEKYRTELSLSLSLSQLDSVSSFLHLAGRNGGAYNHRACIRLKEMRVQPLTTAVREAGNLHGAYFCPDP